MVRRPTSWSRSQTQSVRVKPRLRLDACANARPGASTTPTITDPERLAPASMGPSHCSGISPIKRMKPAPARASAVAASPDESGSSRTTVSELSAGSKGSSAHGSKSPRWSITTACANSRVAAASSPRARVSLPQVPFPVRSTSRPRGRPPIPVRRSSSVAETDPNCADGVFEFLHLSLRASESKTQARSGGGHRLTNRCSIVKAFLSIYRHGIGGRVIPAATLFSIHQRREEGG